MSALIAVPAEKRQLDMLRASYAHLQEKVAANQVAADVMLKLAKFVEFVTYRNYPAASAIQTVCTTLFGFVTIELFLLNQLGLSEHGVGSTQGVDQRTEDLSSTSFQEIDKSLLSTTTTKFPFHSEQSILCYILLLTTNNPTQ